MSYFRYVVSAVHWRAEIFNCQTFQTVLNCFHMELFLYSTYFLRFDRPLAMSSAVATTAVSWLGGAMDSCEVCPVLSTNFEFTNSGVMIELRVLICLWTSGRYAASFCHNIDS